MKCIYLVGLLLLGVLSCRADEDLQDLTKGADSSEEVYAEVKELFEKKCQAVGGEEAVKNLNKVVDELKSCIAKEFPDDPKKFKEIVTDSSSSEELCTDKRKVLRGCLDGLVHAWEDCSVPEEKYVAKFFFDAVDSLLDYLCADDGAVILSLFNEETLDCVFSLAEQDNVTNSCDSKFKVLKDDTPDDLVITKGELCADLHTAKECATEVVTSVCPKDTVLNKAIAGAIKAISTPCNNNRRRRNPLNLPLPYSKK